jgi:hypothetical protein
LAPDIALFLGLEADAVIHGAGDGLSKIGLLLDDGCWLLATGYWLLAACYLLLATCYWLLDDGYWLLAAGYLLLAAGCWALAPERSGVPIVMASAVDTCPLTLVTAPFCTVTFS